MYTAMFSFPLFLFPNRVESTQNRAEARENANRASERAIVAKGSSSRSLQTLEGVSPSDETKMSVAFIPSYLPPKNNYWTVHHASNLCAFAFQHGGQPRSPESIGLVWMPKKSFWILFSSLTIPKMRMILNIEQKTFPSRNLEPGP